MAIKNPTTGEYIRVINCSDLVNPNIIVEIYENEAHRQAGVSEYHPAKISSINLMGRYATLVREEEVIETDEEGNNTSVMKPVEYTEPIVCDFNDEVDNTKNLFDNFKTSAYLKIKSLDEYSSFENC